MAKVDYDQFAGLGRLAEAAAAIDERSAIVLAYHAALEREMDVVLSRLLPRPEYLRNLGFGQKLSVLAAAWKGAPSAGEIVYAVLFRFNELRNAVAHGDRPELVDQKLEELLSAYRNMVPGPTEGMKVEELAAGICGFLADSPPPRGLRVGSFSKPNAASLKTFSNSIGEDEAVTK
jgi:hypothetical protein